MNEQQLQQILTIQQAIAAAATAAMINTLLNPQQAAANLVNQNANTESPTTPNADFHDQDLQDGSNQTSPAGLALNDNNNHHNQHHSNNNNNNNNQLHLQHHQRQDNSVTASLAAVAAAAATGSNMMISPASSQSPNNNNHSNKKLKRHNQAPQAFSRQHNSPGSSSAFLPNNVGLPRKLVRGQDVWLGRGAEQTRQILKCMWCNQSFRTLAEMTQHMKITQHYTNIISQEQITSWKQPEGSEGSIQSGRQHSKQSISSKNLDEFHDVVASASEKSIDSERDDSFSNDEANTPPPQQQQPQLPQSKRQHRTKARPERTISSSNNNTDIKSPASTNSTNNNTSIASATNNENNSDSNEEKSTNEQEQPADLGVGDDEDSESNDENKCKRESASREDSQDNEDDCDKKATKKRQREEDSEADANTNNTDISVKQELGGPVKEGSGGGGGGGVGGSGDPLSALETMVEKSFDPRMRPGVASGGILQRLGIDEEVCPPWQHLNYANWYAAAAYGHPMAAALLAAGMNLQNGIKLSKNMGSKKNDD